MTESEEVTVREPLKQLSTIVPPCEIKLLESVAAEGTSDAQAKVLSDGHVIIGALPLAIALCQSVRRGRAIADNCPKRGNTDRNPGFRMLKRESTTFIKLAWGIIKQQIGN